MANEFHDSRERIERDIRREITDYAGRFNNAEKILYGLMLAMLDRQEKLDAEPYSRKERLQMVEKYYLCDGELPCCSSSHCYANGGGCIHTSNVANSISEKYPEFASTYFARDEIGNFVEHLDPASIMRTFMAGNPTPDLTRFATV